MAGFKTIFNTLTTDVLTVDKEGLGRIRWEDDKCYRWVYNNNTTVSQAVASVVCHLYSNGAVSNQSVDVPATANLGYVAGVVCSPLGLAANTGAGALSYGWVQCYGLVTTGDSHAVSITPVNTQTTAAPVGGAALKAVNTQVYLANDQTMGTAPSYKRTIMCLDSITAGTTLVKANVFVMCL